MEKSELYLPTGEKITMKAEEAYSEYRNGSGYYSLIDSNMTFGQSNKMYLGLKKILKKTDMVTLEGDMGGVRSPTMYQFIFKYEPDDNEYGSSIMVKGNDDVVIFPNKIQHIDRINDDEHEQSNTEKLGGRRKRKSNRRKSNKRKSNKRRSQKRRGSRRK